MVNLVSFSGGKDSTAMLLMLIEKGVRIDDIIFCDTGKEFPDMLKHISEVEKYIGRSITKLTPEESFDYLFAHKQRKKGSKYENVVGYGWADSLRRWCTSNLKTKTFNKYVRNKYGRDYTLFIGLASDEQKRVQRNKDDRIKYPLVEWGVTEKEALEYCYSKGFYWNSLYKRFRRVSCYLCPLQRKCDWFTLKKYYPDLYEDALRLDKLSPYKFKVGITLEEQMDKWERKELIKKGNKQ